MSLKFVIAAENNADVLARVVLLFHRLAVEIESIRMPARRDISKLHITITVTGRHAQTHRMEASLSKLVDVFSVETILTKARSTPRAGA